MKLEWLVKHACIHVLLVLDQQLRAKLVLQSQTELLIPIVLVNLGFMKRVLTALLVFIHVLHAQVLFQIV